MIHKKANSLFKDYLEVAAPYKGGKAISEVYTGHKKIYKLSSNENPIGASPKAVAAIKANLDNLHIYPDRTDRRLCEALYHYYEGTLEPEQFIGASSGSEIIDHIVRAFAGVGFEVIISNPSFKPYDMFASWLGSKVIDVPLTGDTFQIDVKAILQAVTDRTRIIFLTSPNNPTGSYIPKQDIQYLLEHVPNHVVVVLDEVYFHFAEAADYTIALPFVKQGHQIIAVNSFSKTYGLAAMRIGYAYTTKVLADYIHKICKPFLIDSLSLEAGIAALQDTEFVAQTVRTVKEGRAFLFAELDRLGLKYWKSQANFVLIRPDIPVDQFEQFMLQEGIMIRPVANFGAPGCVRVSVGMQEANQAFIAALEKMIKK